METEESGRTPEAARRRSLCVVLNEEAAGDGAMHEALRQLRAQGHEVEARLILGPGDALRIAAEAARQGVDVVVAAGGDGTLNEIVNGVFRAAGASACAVVPFGTANDFAACCGIPTTDPLAALSLAAEGEITPIDVGQVNDRLFINVASGGFGAEVTAETRPEVKQLLGGFAYLLTGLAKVANLSARQAHISAPEYEWEGDILALSVGNGRQAGGGFQMCPSALLDDGLLDVMIIPEVALDSLVTLIRDLVRLGGPLGYEHVTYFQTPWLEVRVDDELQVNLDGEPLRGRSFRFEVPARRLPFCLPAGAPLKR